MDILQDILKHGTELLEIPQGTKKEKLANEILRLHKIIIADYHRGVDDYDEKIGEVHGFAMAALRELDRNEEALEEGEKALEFEDTLDDDFMVKILSEMLGVCIKLYKKKDNREYLNEAKMYGKKLLKIDRYHKLKSHIEGLDDL